MFYSEICIPEAVSLNMDKLGSSFGKGTSVVRVLKEKKNFDDQPVRRIIIGSLDQLTLPSDTIFTQIKVVKVSDHDIQTGYCAPEGWVIKEIPDDITSYGVDYIWWLTLGHIESSFREKDFFDKDFKSKVAESKSSED